MKPTSPARELIQRFQVTGRLGTGAMGEVYRARDPQLGREVAIKVLAHPAARASDGLSPHDTIDLRGDAPAGELLVEAQLMARLSHPNVLPVYEVGLADGEVFVVMEHIAGSDLRSWLGRPRSTREILDLFTQAAGGLAAAHAHGIVHRDFKPENVLVGDDGRVRVADFGLSRLTSRAGPALRVEPVVGGTPYYMAPELWRGGTATPRSDVFALCTALAEAFGNEPDQRASLDRTLRERGVRRRLRAAIAAGLAEDPEARPELDQVIAALVDAGPGRARWAIAAVAASAAGVALFVAARSGEPGCQADDVRFAGTWDGARRAALVAAGVADRVDKHRTELAGALRTACAAEKSGELTPLQARVRTSCLERRGIELDAAATLIITTGGKVAAARDLLDFIPQPEECDRMAAAPLPSDRAAVADLYRRKLATEIEPVGSPKPNVELAALEGEARALGERELEARVAFSLGMRLIETDQLTAADASLARAHDLAMAIQVPGLAAEALVKRGVVAGKRGDPEVRYTYSKLAAELADKATALPGDRVFVYTALAQAELDRGQPGRALELAEKTLAIIQSEAPDPYSESAARLVLIHALHELGGNEERALQLARQNLELERKTLGERHPDYGIALNIVAIALRYAGDHAAALDHRRRALAVMEATLPAGHSAVLGQQMNVANDLYANGRFEEARAAATQHLAAADENESLRESRSMSQTDLGAFTFATGRIEEGMRLFEQGLEGMVAQYGQDHPAVLDAQLNRIHFELELGRVDDAERHADSLERTYRARDDQARALARLDGVFRAQIALAHKKPRDAEARARAALSGWRELRGDESDRAELLRVLAISLIDQRRFAEALDLLASAEAILRARRALDDRFALVDVERARALAGLGRKPEAGAVAARARRVLDRFPGHLRARAAADALLARLRTR